MLKHSGPQEMCKDVSIVSLVDKANSELLQVVEKELNDDRLKSLFEHSLNASASYLKWNLQGLNYKWIPICL